MPGPFPSGEIPWCLAWCFGGGGGGGWRCGIGCIQLVGGVALVVWCVYIYIYVYIYVCVCVYVHIYIYIYIYIYI